MLPHVTCLVTCYNEKPFIEAAIASILAQTRADTISEIIVVNDGSTDGSTSLLDGLAKEDPRIRVFHIANRGISGARNFGLHRVATPFVALLDGDDLWHRDKIARQMEVLSRSSDTVALWYSDFVDFSCETENGLLVPVRVFSEQEENTLTRYFEHDAPIVPSTVIMRMDALRKAGFFDEKLHLFEEMDMWLRLAATGYRFQHVHGGLTFKRARAGSLSGNTHRWEGAFNDIGERWVARCPILRLSLRRRNSYRLGKIAQQYFAAGSDRLGWSHVGRSLRTNPLNGRAYAYALLAIFPYAIRKIITRTIKDTRAKLFALKNSV